jgi:hypothetical protein
MTVAAAAAAALVVLGAGLHVATGRLGGGMTARDVLRRGVARVLTGANPRWDTVAGLRQVVRKAVTAAASMLDAKLPRLPPKAAAGTGPPGPTTTPTTTGRAVAAAVAVARAAVATAVATAAATAAAAVVATAAAAAGAVPRVALQKKTGAQTASGVAPTAR